MGINSKDGKNGDVKCKLKKSPSLIKKYFKSAEETEHLICVALYFSFN